MDCDEHNEAEKSRAQNCVSGSLDEESETKMEGEKPCQAEVTAEPAATEGGAGSLQVGFEVTTETVLISEQVKGLVSKDGGGSSPNRSPVVDGRSVSGAKRARTAVDERQPSVHFVYNSLSRASRQKLEELLLQWSEWHAKHVYSSSDPSEVLESGEETFFPALHVGLEKSSAVSFWMDNQTTNDKNKDFIPLDDNSVPLYDRGYALGLTSAGGSTHWWRMYGLSTPNLQKLAIKILSLTCSSSGCERNWSVFEHVVMDAVNKPRNITYKGLTDLVTETDKMSEAAILEVVKKNFEDHLILGEEGGIIGDAASDYLWCIDPLDGTTNFAHGYPSFAVSVGVLYQGRPAAAAVVEFVGGPMCWNTRIFSATSGGGALCNGHRIQVSATNQVERSLLVTGFGYEHDDAWATNIDLFREFTDVSRGVRRLGAAAVDMCHVALGIVEAYWEYRLKPWDMAAGVLMVEEAGGAISRMDGGKFCVFDRSVLVSNGVLHAKLLERIGPATEKLKSKGIDFSLWYKPEDYRADV